MENQFKTKEGNKHLLDLYLKGELGTRELENFLHFLQTNKGQELVEQHMSETGFSEDSHQFINKRQSNKIYKQINSKMKQRRNRFRLVFKIAASFLLLAGLGLGSYRISNHPDFLSEKNIQAYNKQQQIMLPDGTKVRLNSGSRLLYSKDMNKQKKRRVYLKGEAFFEVAKNPEKPFLINADKAEVTVLGTVFNVKTISGKNTVVVAVQEGKVSLKGYKQEDGVILTANEVGIVKANENSKKMNQPAQNYFSWFENYLEFENIPLPQVIEQLETIFDTNIELLSPVLNDKYFTAYMRATSVDEVMNQLCLSLNLKLEKNNGKYFLKQ